MAYADPKEHGGKTYHGMKVGGTHRWTYPDGEWSERKVMPNRWDIQFTSLKRRQRNAPVGSGAEVGSGYHWLIVAHQWVDKLDANTYATHLEGEKHLIAFKKPGWRGWNTQFRGKNQAKEKTIKALEEAIVRLRQGPAVEDPVAKAALEELAAKAVAAAQVIVDRPVEPGMERPQRRPRPARRKDSPVPNLQQGQAGP